MNEIEWERNTADHLIQVKKQQDLEQFVAKQRDQIIAQTNASPGVQSRKKGKAGQIVVEGQREQKDDKKQRMQGELENRVSVWCKKAEFFNIFYLSANLQTTGVAQKAEDSMKKKTTARTAADT